MDKQIQELLEAIAETYVENVKTEMIAVGLQDSDIIEEVTYKINGYTIELIIPEYYKYIESGRKPFAKRVPPSALLKWMIRKGIFKGQENKAVWAVRENIFKNGIRPRPFLEKALDNAENEIISKEILTINFEKIIDEKIRQYLKV